MLEGWLFFRQSILTFLLIRLFLFGLLYEFPVYTFSLYFLTCHLSCRLVMQIIKSLRWPD